MNHHVFTDERARYTRISKAKARKLWGQVDIALCPVNLRPGYPWAPHIVVPAAAIREGLVSEYDFERDEYTFDNMTSDFESYNCTCNETGKYAAFYLVSRF